MWYRIYFQGNSVLVERSPDVELLLKNLAEDNTDDLPTFVNLDGTWVRPSSILAWNVESTVNRPMRLAWVEKSQRYELEKPETE